jgi:hypothetical protein
MSDDVGIVSVVTREQIDRAHRLREVAGELRAVATALDVTTPRIPSWQLTLAALPPTVGSAGTELDVTSALLRDIATDADALAAASLSAAGEYGERELQAKGALAAIGSLGGALGGFVGGTLSRGLLVDAGAVGIGTLAALGTAPGGPLAVAALVSGVAALDPGGRAI